MWSIPKHLSVHICRLLAREGISADQLTRDLKSFELKVQSLSLKQMYAPTIYGWIGQSITNWLYVLVFIKVANLARNVVEL